jgi:hypothetical protein
MVITFCWSESSSLPCLERTVSVPGVTATETENGLSLVSQDNIRLAIDQLERQAER